MWKVSSAGKRDEQVTIGFVLIANWLKKCHEFFNQSRSVVKQNLSKHEISSDLFRRVRLVPNSDTKARVGKKQLKKTQWETRKATLVREFCKISSKLKSGGTVW